MKYINILGIFALLLFVPTAYALPDLVITDVSFDPANPMEREEVHVTITAQNIGDEAISPNHNYISFAFDGNNKVGTSNNIHGYNQEVAPGEEFIVEDDLKFLTSNSNNLQGINTEIVYLVDSGNIFEEADEDNNEYTVQLNLQPMIRPDISIKDIEFGEGEYGEESTLYIEIENLGETALSFPEWDLFKESAVSDHNVVLDWLIKVYSYNPDFTMNYHFTEDLAAGAKTTVEIEGVIKKSVNARISYAGLDDNQKYKYFDSDQDNNYGYVSIEAPTPTNVLPDFTVISFTGNGEEMSLGSIGKGTEVDFKAIVSNVGALDHDDDVTVHFYINQHPTDASTGDLIFSDEQVLSGLDVEEEVELDWSYTFDDVADYYAQVTINPRSDDQVDECAIDVPVNKCYKDEKNYASVSFYVKNQLLTNEIILRDSEETVTVNGESFVIGVYQVQSNIVGVIVNGEDIGLLEIEKAYAITDSLYLLVEKAFLSPLIGARIAILNEEQAKDWTVLDLEGGMISTEEDNGGSSGGGHAVIVIPVNNTNATGCQSDEECDDGDACTQDTCLSNGQCSRQFNHGCSVENECVAIGTVIGDQYCFANELQPLREDGMSCVNDYECTAQKCNNGACGQKTLIRRIFSWFASIFS